MISLGTSFRQRGTTGHETGNDIRNQAVVCGAYAACLSAPPRNPEKPRPGMDREGPRLGRHPMNGKSLTIMMVACVVLARASLSTLGAADGSLVGAAPQTSSIS